MPIRISPEHLREIGEKVINNLEHYPLDSHTINIIHGNKLSKRTWKGKQQKLKQRRLRMKEKQKRCKQLPTIANINARSIKTKTEILNQYLDDSQLDIVCITETWMTTENLKITEQQFHNNYTAVSNVRDTKRGGGTTILINKKYSSHVKQINIDKNLDDENNQIEITMAKIRPARLPRGYSSCFIACVYITPKNAITNNTIKHNEKGTDEIAQAIIQALDLEKSVNKQLLFVCGDFNGAKSKTLCNQLQVKQINSAPTRKGNLLDPIFTNAPNCYTCTNQLIIKSDHEAVIAKPIMKKYKELQPAKQKITTRTGKIEETVEEIGNIEWGEIIKLNDQQPQTKFDVFYDTLNAIQNTCQPIKTITIKNDQPWMTPYIKRLIQQRQKLHRDQKHNEWYKMAKIIRHQIKKRKKIYYNRFKNKDSKTWWKIVNEVNGRETKHQKIELTAEQLNNGFHQVWNGQAKPDISSFIKPPQKQDTKTKTFRITEDMILDELGKLDTSKAPGPDNINNKLLKYARFELCEVITHLFNLSIQQSFIPTQWKTANIIPIPKISNPEQPGDFRPIALTSALCKVFERIIVKQVLNHTKSLWANNKQYGFLPGRNTMDALMQVIEDWEKARDEKKTVHAVFFDFAKAFDLVNHNILLAKIDKMLPSWLTSWIAQYLTGRKQRVRCNNNYSNWLDVEAGVTQGSVLGPALFLLFISDVNEYLPTTAALIKYADDLLTYCIFNDFNEDTTQQTIDSIQKWAENNSMRLNTDKTKHMIINQLVSGPTNTTLNNHALEQVNNYKYLGAILNDQLDYDQQWEKTAKTTNCHIYLIKQLKKMGFKEEILVNVYKSITLSQYIYNAPLLSSASTQAKNEMSKQQKRFFNIIGITAEKALNEYKIPPIDIYVDQQNVNIVERILKDPTHPITQNQQKKSQYNTRSSQYTVPRARTTQYQDSCLQRAMRTIRDGYKDKYTNPRKPETTTTEYIVEIKSVKNQNNKIKNTNNQKTSPNNTTEQQSLDNRTCNTCNQTFKSAAGLKQHITKKHK